MTTIINFIITSFFHQYIPYLHFQSRLKESLFHVSRPRQHHYFLLPGSSNSPIQTYSDSLPPTQQPPKCNSNSSPSPPPSSPASPPPSSPSAPTPSSSARHAASPTASAMPTAARASTIPSGASVVAPKTSRTARAQVYVAPWPRPVPATGMDVTECGLRISRRRLRDARLESSTGAFALSRLVVG